MFNLFALASTLFIISCNHQLKQEEAFDLKESDLLVVLDSSDLNAFLELRQQLKQDSIVLKQQDKDYGAPEWDWMSTNSYYLNQIDSIKYAKLYQPLKTKMSDNICIKKENGAVLFTLKERAWVRLGKQKEMYSHGLLSRDCDCSIDEVFGRIDKIFVDSIINKDWRYVYFKAFVGH